MQWTLTGAQAMLNLRSVTLNDYWREFNNFRIQQESERLYPYRKPVTTSDAAYLG